MLQLRNNCWFWKQTKTVSLNASKLEKQLNMIIDYDDYYYSSKLYIFTFTYSHLADICTYTKKLFNMVLILRYEDCHILIGVSSFEVGTDCLCESSSHRQCVLGPHGEGTGPSRTAWENKNTHAELQRVYRQNAISISHWNTTQRQIDGWQRMGKWK